MVIRSKAPLRLGLAGGGTDIAEFSDIFGGYILNATIDLYAYCSIEIIKEKKIEFIAADLGRKVQYEYSPYICISDILPLHEGVYNRVIKQFCGGRPISMRMTTYADVPAGSGLGSSSTIVVAMLKAYTELLNLPLGDYELAHLAFEIERIDLGFKGGKQDQYAATFGGFNFIEFNREDRVIVNPLRVKNWIIDEFESSLVLFNMGTSRESAKIIEEQSNNILKKDSIVIDALQEMKHDAILMKEAILKGNIDDLAEILDLSWKRKKMTAKLITNDRIDEIYNAAKEAGAYAGKISGAGGGGFMMFVVNPAKKIEVINQLRKFDGMVLNAHFTKEGTKGWKIFEGKQCF